MDRIITFILFFYFISIFIKFLKGDEKKRGHPPTVPPRPSRLPQPSAPSPHHHPREEEKKPLDIYLSKREEEARNILAEWEKRAGRQQESPKPKIAQPKVVPQTKVKVTTSRDELLSKRAELRLERRRITTEEPSLKTEMPASGKLWMQEKKGIYSPEIEVSEGISSLERVFTLFTQADMIEQAVIMSEILGPPLVFKNPLLPPYRRV